MTLSKSNTPLNHINSITHDGKVLVFATAADGTVYYTVRFSGFENGQETDREIKDWGNWQELPMPDGQKDASVETYERENYTDIKGGLLISSSYDKKTESVAGVVQLISGLGFVYVFRQSAGGKLLVDRFVLDGMNNRLIRKLEVRYKRSRKKHTPLQAPSGNNKIQFDSLNFRDANGQPFYEPTVALDLQATMDKGWFSVLLLPTELQDEYRWHFFYYLTNQRLGYTSVRASNEGLFDLKDRGGAVGIEVRRFELTNEAKQPLTITGAPVATKYDVQAAEENQLGETNLVRTSTRVMLVVPTDQGAATIDFAVTTQGRLSSASKDAMIQEAGPPLIGNDIVLQLPPATLKEIQVHYGQPEVKGRILGLERTTDGKILLKMGKGDVPPTSDQVYIQGTRSLNGLYRVSSVSAEGFEIVTEMEESDAAELQSDYAIGTLERAVKKGHKTLRVVKSLETGIPAGTSLQVANADELPITFSVRKDTSADTETIWIEPATAALPAGSTVYDQANVAVNKIRHELGEWREAPPAINQQVGAGKITGLHPTSTGKLSLNAHHDLQQGDQVDIEAAPELDGWHDVLRADADGIVLDTSWRGGSLTNRSRKDYAGLQLSGQGEKFDLELKEKSQFGCLEFRIKVDERLFFIPFCLNGTCYKGEDESGEPVDLKIRFAEKYGLVVSFELEGFEPSYLEYNFHFSNVNLVDGRWHHLAYVWDKEAGTHTLYLDGQGYTNSFGSLNYLNFHHQGLTGDNVATINDKKFKGQLADFRLWRKPRSQQEIRETMFSRLSGQEGHLLGYWPLDSIVEDTRLLDQSKNQNHGKITGNVFIPGKRLSRGEGAVAFENDTLIAVTQGAAYTESFQFRPTGNPENRSALFAFGLWGKRSRKTEERFEHDTFGVTQNSVTELPLGWYTASCSFVVPEGVSLIRSFRIDNFEQEWSSLEVRNHTIKSTSNSISKQLVEESASLPALAKGGDDGARILADIQAKEYAASNFHKELIDLLEESRAFENQVSYNAERNRRVARVSILTEAKLQYVTYFDNLRVNFFNYWLELDNVFGRKLLLDINSYNNRIFTLNEYSGDSSDSGKFQFIPSANEGYYYMLCKEQDRYIQKLWVEGLNNDIIGHFGSQYNSNKLEVSLEKYTNDELPGRFTNTYRLRTISGAYIGIQNSIGALTSRQNEGVIFTFKIKSANRANPEFRTIQQLLSRTLQSLKDAENELEEYSDALSLTEIAGKRKAVNDRIEAIRNDELPANERALLSLRQQFREVLNADVRGLEMEELSNAGDVLITSGGLLNFIQSKHNSLNLFASADGNIYLNYFDQQGQLRQPYYDTVSDAGSKTFETWVPAAHRLCLNTSVVGAGLTIDEEHQIPLTSEWTIECKFFFPFPNDDTRHRSIWRDSNKVIENGEYVQAADSHFYSYCLFGNGEIHSPASVPSVLVRVERDGRMVLGSMMKNIIRKINPNSDIFYTCGYDLNNEEEGWHHLTVVGTGYGPGSNTTFYLDGKEIGDIKKAATSKLSSLQKDPANDSKSLMVGAAAEAVDCLNMVGRPTAPITSIGFQAGYLFGEEATNAGKIAEVRIWKTALSAEEVEINAAIPSLTGIEPGLMAYLPLNGNSLDVSKNGHDAVMADAGVSPDDHYHPFTGSINQFGAADAIPRSIVANEYSTVGIDPDTRKKTAMLRRFLAYPSGGGVQLLSQQRVEELDLRWLGNAQINPTLLGFIEGAPPVPSENLTEDPTAYQGATSVEMVTEEDLSFSWDREDASSLGMDLDLFVGAAGSFNALIASGSYKAGVAGDLSLSNTSFNQSSIGATASSSQTNRLELRGYPEQKAHFPHLGPRFVPKNVGYALVVSGTADVYITRLRRSGRMVAYSVQPNPDIPLDVNTITFLINPAYTMNGSLDGLTGTRPTSERYFKDVKEMRAQYGSAFPASYFRVEEAYALKELINKQDKERAAYFANFDVRDLEGEVDRVVGAAPGEDDETKKMAEEKQAELESRIENEEDKVQAMSAFAAWQRKMESLSVKAGKRNIVNTYVWDADGGLRVEEQQFASTIEHTVGGSFYLGGSIGFSGEFEGSAFGVGAAAALNVAATLSMSQTMSKMESRSSALSLKVDLSGLESLGITDFKDNPLLPGEKVDRYRFMSFFLEGDTNHYNDFFNEVVDPEWLAGNDEEARALRRTQLGKPNKAWRIFHRVTYVERPALQGFGKK